MKRPAPKAWHKLDNTAHLFPVIANRKTSNVFRLTALLARPVEPALLQEAVCEILPHFAAFQVRMRHGLFWNYMEANDATPAVRAEEMPLCHYLDPLETGRYLFRVIYFENRVHLETFHVLSDGTGALRFLKAICYRYLQLACPELDDHHLYGLEGASNVEDCYLKYTTPTEEKKTYKQAPAFKLRGAARLAGDVGTVSLLLSVEEFKALCAKAGVTVGVYLAALLLYTARQEHMPLRGSKKPINLFVPVNLRTVLGGDTSLNFISSFVVNLPCPPGPADFDAILADTQRQFQDKCTKEQFSQRLAYTAKAQLNPFVRATPLPFKNAVLRLIYEGNNRGSSFSFSNLGLVRVDPHFENQFTGFRFHLPPAPKEPVKCTACAFGDTLALNFTTFLEQHSMARAAARFLSGQGLAVTVESNGGDHEAL